MTQEEIIRMAREAGVISGFNDVHPSVERFATLVAEREREECAKVCDVYAANDPENFADICAAAIRARSNP